ncbi:hypothetical protein D3C72_383400 [compost metagenome]
MGVNLMAGQLSQILIGQLWTEQASDLPVHQATIDINHVILEQLMLHGRHVGLCYIGIGIDLAPVSCIFRFEIAVDEANLAVDLFVI